MSPTANTICERCGASIEPGMRFCASCGADVSDQQGNVATSMMPVGNTQQLKLSLLDSLRDATLGEYEILIELGSGGMASVYLAHDIQLDRKVAIKVMHPQLLQGEGMIERFRLEARTVAQLSQPNIIPIYAVKQHEGLLFFVMKFVEGQPLDGIVKKQGALPPEMVRHLVGKVAEALGYAHRNGVIHRDIKPANIMVDVEGQPIVTDFGIAKVANTEGLTMTGAAIGTPNYMSPEQCHAMPLTGASDQYSLGVMAYEMLTGRVPFDGGSAMGIMFKHVNEAPAPILGKVPHCPPDLAIAVEKMLAKRPEDRYASMEEVVRAIAAPTMMHDHPVRTQLIQYAMEGENRRLLKRVSTPRSPIPSVVARTAKGTARAAAAPPTISKTPAPVAPPKRNFAAVAGVASLLVVAGALAVFQPWKHADAGSNPSTTPSGPESLQVATQAPVEPPAVAADSLPAGGATPAEPAPPPPVTARPQQNPPASKRATPPAPVQVEPQPESAAPSTSGPRLHTVKVVQILGPNSMGVGETAVLEADPLDAAGQEVPGRQVTWTSSAPTIVSVNGAGQVVARQEGRAIVTASMEEVSGSIAITVAAAAVANLGVSPDALRVEVGATGVLTASVSGAVGRPVNHTVSWSSSGPQIASVSAEGVVTGRAPGTVVITATAGGRQATANVTVVAAGPTEAEVRAEVTAVIQSYARALEKRDVNAVRAIYPDMTSDREGSLRKSLAAMKSLQVELTPTDVRIVGDQATVVVSGKWKYTANGQRGELPADNVYQLARRGSWIITDIR